MPLESNGVHAAASESPWVALFQFVPAVVVLDKQHEHTNTLIVYEKRRMGPKRMDRQRSIQSSKHRKLFLVPAELASFQCATIPSVFVYFVPHQQQHRIQLSLVTRLGHLQAINTQFEALSLSPSRLHCSPAPCCYIALSFSPALLVAFSWSPMQRPGI